MVCLWASSLAKATQVAIMRAFKPVFSDFRKNPPATNLSTLAFVVSKESMPIASFKM